MPDPLTGHIGAQAIVPWTLRLEDADAADPGLVGGKVANLARLWQANFPVPPGFCVTTAAFRQFLARTPPMADVARNPSPEQITNPLHLTELSKRLQSVLANTPMPPAVEQAILNAWREQGENQTYAVRSSATVEDAADHSFAGQFESYLHVHGREALLAAIRKCWLSLYSVRALMYQAKEQLPLAKAAMAVLVQRMVPAGTAGVLFTIDPITGRSDHMMIEATQGLGDRLVSGRVTPERVVLEKRNFHVLKHRSAGPILCLNQRQRRRLGQLAQQMEKLLGGPQDIEWAIADRRCYILQARAITALPRARSWEDRQRWSNVNTGEVFPDVVTPMTWSMIQGLLFSFFCSLGRMLGVDAQRAPVAGLVAGRIYFNANTGLAMMKPFWFLLRRIPNIAQALGGGMATDYERGLMAIPEEDVPDLGFRWSRFILSWPRIAYDLITHSPRRGDAFTVRMKALVDEYARADVAALSTPDLIAFFHRLLQDGLKAWDLLYLVTQAAVLPIFQKACHHWLDDPNLTLGYRLFAGKSGLPETEAGLALWRLAVRAHADPPVETLLLSETGWPQISATLQHTEPGQNWLIAWNAFMSEHGHHCRGELELNNPRWSETPDYILGIVRGYLRVIDQANPLEKEHRLAEERRRLTAECRRRLRNPLKRWIFTRALRRAQKLAINREEWKNLVVRKIAVLRKTLLLLGSRLHQAGQLDQPEDVFFLEISEISGVALNPTPIDTNKIIAQRREEYLKNLALNPPPSVIGRYDPQAPVAPVTPTTDQVLSGIPVFPGVVTGPARVILRANNHEQVLPGEILIAPFTDPAWTPYFVTAAGVVMDQGGILSHGSIIAREYGLPAVTNVASATQLVRTGDVVHVDGNLGRVTILERATIGDCHRRPGSGMTPS